MANILILGGGFAGLAAAEKLSSELGAEHRITLVAPNRKFTFYPALVQLAFGKCELDDIQFDLAAKCNELRVHYVQGELIRLNKMRRTAQIAGDDFSGEIHYDYLVVAVGRRLTTEKTPGFFEYAHHLLGAGAAKKFGDAVNAFKTGTIVLGLCPDGRLPVPVCETAFALAAKFEKEIKEGAIKIKVIFPESVEAAFGGANLHKALETAFERRGINVLYDVPIREITADAIVSRNKHRIKYDLLMLVPPFRGNAAVQNLEASDEEDFVRVDDFMRVVGDELIHGEGLEKIYAAGDIAALPGPKFAHMAVRQAAVAAANIVSEIKGEAPDEVYYHEIAAIIEAGGADSIYLHYGIWDETLYRLKKGSFWGWAKSVHDRFWRAKHG